MERLTLEQLNGAKKEGRVFIMFSTEWCGECKMNTPMIENIEGEFPNTKFFKIDVDENELWNEDGNQDYKIKSVPTFMIYEGGQLTIEHIGFSTPNKIKEILNS